MIKIEYVVFCKNTGNALYTSEENPGIREGDIFVHGSFENKDRVVYVVTNLTFVACKHRLEIMVVKTK